MIRTLQTRFDEYASHSPRISSDIVMTVAAGGDGGYLADYIAQNLSVDFYVKQEILEELNINRRLLRMIRLLDEEIELLSIEGEIQEQLKAALDKNQKEYYLREQIKVMQSELGEQDTYAEAEAYRAQIEALELAQAHRKALEGGRTPVQNEQHVFRGGGHSHLFGYSVRFAVEENHPSAL